MIDNTPTNWFLSCKAIGFGFLELRCRNYFVINYKNYPHIFLIRYLKIVANFLLKNDRKQYP